jgi:hypothetical protein
MPLAFHSSSHGTVPFGFFNIETDMLLLSDLFFFASEFCAAVSELSRGADRSGLDGWRIREPASIGNLHGAIAGEDLSGFIGATYRRWPFPEEAVGFRQQPEGHRNSPQIREMILGFGAQERIELRRAAGPEGAPDFSIAEYRFDVEGFLALAAYVIRGGYPRWRDDTRPAYVLDMSEALKVSSFLQ